MALTDLITSLDPPRAVYLYISPTQVSSTVNGINQYFIKDVLHFQYWPSTLLDEYSTSYAEHEIPGGSHPLYQWVGGKGRQIQFDAIFTSELNTLRSIPIGEAGQLVSNSLLTPSSPYTVNVAAALARIRSWQRADYKEGGQTGNTSPPPILTLVFPGTKINGRNNDAINVILWSAPITYKSWYPNGQPRVATVSMVFKEVVQTAETSRNAGATIKFVGRSEFEDQGKDYQFSPFTNRPLIGGGL